MMTKFEMKSTEKTAHAEPGYLPDRQSELSEEDRSKDVFFAQIAGVVEAMMVRHGKEFAIGTLVLAARFIAEGRPLTNKASGEEKTDGNIKPD
jgi:hypothetical protein